MNDQNQCDIEDIWKNEKEDRRNKMYEQRQKIGLLQHDSINDFINYLKKKEREKEIF